MNYRHKRRPTPGFGIGSPFNPTTGEHAKLQGEGVHPYCAMVQVAAEDTYADYVTCRMFDPRIGKYVAEVSVAKPFGRRVAATYLVGQIFPAFLPTQGTLDYTPPSPTAVNWRVGQNPGTTEDVAEGENGQPEDLDAEITALTDHDDKNVNWMLIDSGGGGDKYFELKDGLTPGSNATAHPLDDAGDADTDADLEFEVYDRWGKFRGREKGLYGAPHALGSQGKAKFNTESEQWEITELEPAALMIRGLLTAALATTDASRTIDGVAVMQPIGGIITDTDPASAVTVYNAGSIFEGDNDGYAFAVWNESTDHWEFIQVECPAA